LYGSYFLSHPVSANRLANCDTPKEDLNIKRRIITSISWINSTGKRC